MRKRIPRVRNIQYRRKVKRILYFRPKWSISHTKIDQKPYPWGPHLPTEPMYSPVLWSEFISTQKDAVKPLSGRPRELEVDRLRWLPTVLTISTPEEGWRTKIGHMYWLLSDCFSKSDKDWEQPKSGIWLNRYSSSSRLIFSPIDKHFMYIDHWSWVLRKQTPKT